VRWRFALLAGLLLVACQDRIPDDPHAPDQGVLAAGATAEEDLLACPTCVEDHTCTHLRKDSVPMVHEGLRYHFCQAQCLVDFREDPERYVAALARYLEDPPEFTPEDEG